MFKQLRSEKPQSVFNNNVSFANIFKNGNINKEYNNSNIPINKLLEDLNNTIQNVATQMTNSQKQIQLQASRIDTIYSILDI